MHQTSAPFNEATLRKLHSLSLERGYHDPAELEIGHLFHTAREPQGFATVPEIQWSRHRRLAVPALFVYSGSSAFSGHGDAERIQRHFPNSLVAPIHGARGMPYVEENEAFHRVVDRFLDRLE
jgi:pimeloyl-ACP methyl ester carboxylesterase